ncbi:hypothetical protein Tco_0295758 [Tanacetum coccineum]
MRVKESLNVRFDESPPPKSSPLVDDDILESEIIENQEKDLEIKENEPLNKEIVNIKETKDLSLDSVIVTHNRLLYEFQFRLGKIMKSSNSFGDRGFSNMHYMTNNEEVYIIQQEHKGNLVCKVDIFTAKVIFTACRFDKHIVVASDDGRDDVYKVGIRSFMIMVMIWGGTFWGLWLTSTSMIECAKYYGRKDDISIVSDLQQFSATDRDKFCVILVDSS